MQCVQGVFSIPTHIIDSDLLIFSIIILSSTNNSYKSFILDQIEWCGGTQNLVVILEARGSIQHNAEYNAKNQRTCKKIDIDKKPIGGKNVICYNWKIKMSSGNDMLETTMVVFSRHCGGIFITFNELLQNPWFSVYQEYTLN